MSARKHRVYEIEFQVAAVERLISGEPIAALAAESGNEASNYSLISSLSQRRFIMK